MSENLDVGLPLAQSRILNAFTSGRYPLSRKGLDLLGLISDSVRSGHRHVVHNIVDDLPTVENPRSELYEDLSGGNEVFGADLDVISLTNGCTHDCHHCIVNAPEIPVTTMPYQGVVKIAEKKKIFEVAIAEVWEDWFAVTQKIRDQLANVSRGELAARRVSLKPELQGLFDAHPIRDMLADYGPKLPGSKDHMRSLYLMYRGDPSDYKDYSFVHDNGEPADWGDAFSTLATPFRPINFSTAGWSEKDKVAFRGAKKITESLEDDSRLSNIVGISINPFDTFYRRDPVAYKAQIERIIDTFGSHCSRLYFSYEPGDEKFFKDFYVPIAYKYLEDRCPEDDLDSMASSIKNRVRIISTSHFAGRGYLEGHEEDRDIMNVSAGNHLLPNGRLALRAHDETAKMYFWGDGYKGGRPVETDFKLWNNLF